MRGLSFASLFVLLLAGVTVPARAPARAQDGPRIVVTIGPVHSLVAGVTQGVVEPQLIMQGAASPHAFAMRPSQAKALERADVIVRVGETLETSLDRPIEALGKSARLVTLDGIEGMTLLPAREGGVWESHDHAEAAQGHEHEGHDVDQAKAEAKHDDHGHAETHGRHEGTHNPHLWLDPKNAIVAVDHIAQVLSETDPGNAAQYQANAGRLTAKLADLDSELAAQTKPLRAKPYLVFHDAYPYFENRYRLVPAGAITVSPERQPGAKRIGEIRAKVRDLGAVCVFSEPQFKPKLIDTIIEGTDSRSGVLDPLGANLEPGPDLYFALMRNMAQALKSCLEAP